MPHESFPTYLRSALAGGLLLLLASCSEAPLGPEGPGPLVASFSHAGTNVIPVSDANLGVDWIFAAESGASGSGAFVAGPGTPHVGSGSAEISTAVAADGYVLAGAILAGTPFADIDGIEYSTYRSAGSAALAIALQVAVNYDPTTNPTDAWQGRLVFEPYYGATVQTGVWQSWDPTTQRGWWATGAVGSAVCPISAPCTWAELLVAFPNARVRIDPLPILFKAGSGWGAFTGNVDGLTVSVNGVETTWDFGPAAPQPETRADCMKGGWIDFGFRNQGLCIQFVNTGKDSR